MGTGIMTYTRTPLTIDYLAPADTSLLVVSNALFSTSDHDIIEVTVTDVSGRNTKRNVVLVVNSRII